MLIRMAHLLQLQHQMCHASSVATMIFGETSLLANYLLLASRFLGCWLYYFLYIMLVYHYLISEPYCTDGKPKIFFMVLIVCFLYIMVVSHYLISELYCTVLTINQRFFRDIVTNYADILFANANEARAFCELSSTDSPMSAARYLSHSVPLVSVTDGVHGSYIGVKGEAIYIPPPPCVPIDTCGAGDAYASGILYGILRGSSDLKSIGLLASRVAAIVVAQQGTRLRVQDADRLAESFTLHLDNLEFCSDIETDHVSNFWSF